MALELAALHAALGLLSQPNLVPQARRNELPSGVTLLLEIAANDSDALEQSVRATNVKPEKVQQAAEFFLEQVLFEKTCSSYRVLGTDASATSDVLRRNMALLMRWLHPDIHMSSTQREPKLDRSVFADRVTEAWDNLKTIERRQAYDRALLVDSVGHAGAKNRARHKKPRKLKVAPKCNESWLVRLLGWLKRKR